MTGPCTALDGGCCKRIDFQVVRQDLEKLQLFLAGMAVGGHDLAGKRVSRLAQPGG